MGFEDSYKFSQEDPESHDNWDDVDEGEDEVVTKMSSRPPKSRTPTDSNDFDQMRALHPKGQLYDYSHYLANESGEQVQVFRVFLPVGSTDIEPADLHRWTIDCGGFEFKVDTDDNYNIIDLSYPSPVPMGNAPYPVSMLLATIDWLNAQLNDCRNPRQEDSR